VLLRLSGTEPLLRIYTEAGTPQAATQLAVETSAWVGVQAPVGTHQKNRHRTGSASLRPLPKISPAGPTAYLRKNARQILGLALFALLVHDIFGAHGFIAMRKTQREIEQIREQIGKLNHENQSLSAR